VTGGPTRAAPSTLAAERTHLAWRRTAIGLTGGGVAAAHLLQEFTGLAAWSIAAVAVVVSVALAAISHRRHLADGSLPPGGRLVAASTAGVVLIGVAAVAFVVLHGP
jgi:putative membrane protein